MDYVLWLPLGSNPSALKELSELRDERLAFLEARRAVGKPFSIRQLLRLMLRDIPDVGRVALDIAARDGADSRWVYRVADPVMVFALLPLLFLLSGVALGGLPGLLVGVVLLLSIWWVLVLRLRKTMRSKTMDVESPRDATLTLPNALTAGRLCAIWLFPVLLNSGHPLRAVVFFAAIASTDWADGFIARHYRMQSRLGTMLDPATDRALMIVVGLTLLLHHDLTALYVGKVPVGLYVGVLVVAREICTALVTVLFFRPGSRQSEPNATVHWAGKLGFGLNSVGVVMLLSAPPLPTFVKWFGLTALASGTVLNLLALHRYAERAHALAQNS
jgi:cardiolipin synthase